MKLHDHFFLIVQRMKNNDKFDIFMELTLFKRRSHGPQKELKAANQKLNDDFAELRSLS